MQLIKSNLVFTQQSLYITRNKKTFRHPVLQPAPAGRKGEKWNLWNNVMTVFAGIAWKIATRIQMDAVMHAARIRMNVNRYASVHLGGITILRFREEK